MLLDVTSIAPDRILLLDTFFQVLVRLRVRLRLRLRFRVRVRVRLRLRLGLRLRPRLRGAASSTGSRRCRVRVRVRVRVSAGRAAPVAGAVEPLERTRQRAAVISVRLPAALAAVRLRGRAWG